MSINAHDKSGTLVYIRRVEERETNLHYLRDRQTSVTRCLTKPVHYGILKEWTKELTRSLVNLIHPFFLVEPEIGVEQRTVNEVVLTS